MPMRSYDYVQNHRQTAELFNCLNAKSVHSSRKQLITPQ